jgi:non-specific serine/threonine protein kinase/serine/threonine-protein kinase
MTAERWQKVKQVFQAAIELQPDGVSTFLDGACGEDESLRKEVEQLLASHNQASTFIERPAIQPAAGLGDMRFGPYQVIRKLGQGGMGSVYLAARADEQFQKRVAIKVVQAGIDTEEVLRRFRHERQILATLDHQNIAKLLDGGTSETGLPYFVMEYVEGTPVNEYCERQRLSVAERLKLFLQVCSAVQYVHQNLVVHRDIKPGNILVTPEGTPKLLDFGIAKLVRPEYLIRPDDSTRFNLRLMTPGYASPEQVRGEPITTGSDVYSLGVVLYELLAGCKPYQFHTESPAELFLLICERDPEKPSTAVTKGGDADARKNGMERLSSALKGDLDHIILKAMRKEVHRRYSSVELLAEDIRRHLEGFPVSAHEDSLRYRVGKFVRRNRAGVAAAGLLLLSLIGGIAATTWQARRAEAQRVRAERRFNDVRKMANSFLFEIHDAIQNLPGSTQARELLVRRALEYLDSLASESGDDPALRAELAHAYRRVGDVQGNPNNANLGQTAAAVASYRKALAIAQGLAAQDPSSTQAIRTLALVTEKYGDLLAWSGDIPTGVRFARRALTLWQQLAREDSANSGARMAVAISHLKLGDLLGHPNFPNQGDRAGALIEYRISLSILQALFSLSKADAAVHRFLGLVNERIGTMLVIESQLAEAARHFDESLRLRESYLAASPNNVEARRDVAIAQEKAAELMLNEGNSSGALEKQRRSLETFKALAESDPSNANAARSLAISYQKLGGTLAKTGKTGESLDAYENGRSILENLASSDQAGAQVRQLLRDLLMEMSDVSARAGDLNRSNRLVRRARELDQSLSRR